MSEASGQSAKSAISFGRFRLVPTRQLLLEADKPVHVGSRALAILVALTERAGEVISKDELISRVWPDTFVEEGNLRVHIAALRRALGDDHAGKSYVANVPGRGYRFVAPITLEEEPNIAALRGHVKRSRDLPLPLTRIIGRAELVAALAGLLIERRFVTIVGPGGIGKTRVALAVAHEASDRYPDGVGFVDLASLVDPLFMPNTVGSALGLTMGSENPMPGLVGFLADKQMLLVLDSCEHVIEAAAAFAVDLLRGAPGLHFLATSREPLRAEGERVHRLAPLGLPPTWTSLSATEALTYPAVQLFTERAAAVLDGFELSDADAPVVAEICCRLDGIALAIELAAGRVDAFGVRGVAARLDDRLRLLTRGRRTALPRHQTLSATLDWSYEMLSEAERAMLRLLGVFAGRFGLDAVSAIMSPPGLPASDVAEIIASLVAKSLVTANVAGATPEYRLLDTTRAYAVAKLMESGQYRHLVRRHAEYYWHLFEHATAEGEKERMGGWTALYGREIDNVRAALDWAFSSDGDRTIGIGLTVASVPLWMHLLLLDACRLRTEQALAALDRKEDAEARQHMQLLVAWCVALLLTKGSTPDLTMAWARALEVAEQLGDVEYRLRSLWGLFVDRLVTRQYRAGLALAEEFRTVAEQSGEPAEALIGERMMGTALHILGDQDRARHHIERALRHDIRRMHIGYPLDHRVVAHSIHARILWLLGFADEAIRAAEASIAEARAIDDVVSLFYALVQACSVSFFVGELSTADRVVWQLLELSSRRAMDPWTVWGQAFRGVLLMRRGDLAAGLQLVRAALAGLPENAFHIHYTSFLCEMAHGVGRLGDSAKGLATVDEALARSGRDKERWCMPELLRVKGELLLLENPANGPEADEHYQEALDRARGHGALAWELRTSISRARLLRDRGRRAEARALLKPVYDRFTEGFSSPDMMAAKELLEELT